MRICSNCKTNDSVAQRALGERYDSRDPRESSTPSHVDMCNACWSALRTDRFDTLNSRYRPFTSPGF